MTLVLNILLACAAAGVVAALGLALRGAAGRDPVLRYRVLRAHLLAILVLPAVQLLAPSLDLLPRGGFFAGDETPAAASPSVAQGRPGATAEEPRVRGGEVARAATAGVQRGPSISWWGLGAGLYLAGAGVPLAWSLRRAVAAAAVVRRAVPVSDARVLGAWDALRVRAELRRTARRSRLLESAGLVSPACWGVVWPAVVVPCGFAGGRADRTVRCALHHELIHLRRADHLVAAVSAAVGALLWPQPLLRRFGRALEEDRESSCDALVVRATGRAHEYAAALIDCCSRAGGALPVSMGSGPYLRRRILMLSHAAAPASSVRSRLVAGASAAAIITLLGVTGLLACAAAPARAGASASGDRASIEVRAPAGERDPAKIVRVMQNDPAIGDRVAMTGTLAEQETIASGRVEKTADGGLSMEELNLSLPEGSNLRATVSGDGVSMRPGKDGAELSLTHGEIKIADRKGVNRVTVSAADADATLVVRTKEENEEYNFTVSAVRNGGPSRVVIRWDDRTGRPAGETSTPPGEFRFYTLDGRGANKDVWELKMQWCHDLSKVAAPEHAQGGDESHWLMLRALAAVRGAEAKSEPPVGLLRLMALRAVQGEGKSEPGAEKSEPGAK